MGDGREEEVGNQYVKEGGQGVAARNSPLLGAGKKKQDFSPPLQPISLTTKQSWSKTLIGGEDGLRQWLQICPRNDLPEKQLLFAGNTKKSHVGPISMSNVMVVKRIFISLVLPIGLVS